MHDLGAIIWIIIVLVGVVSSIRKNAQRARGRRAPVQPPPAFEMPPVEAIAPPRPVPAPKPAPPRKPAPPAPVFNAFPAPAPVGTSPIRGMFGGSATLVRAIVAAEVLGPPKALQEQTIWSPRRSEPSI